MRLGFLGTGAIASAVVEGIAKSEHDITVSTRNEERSSELSRRFENVSVADNQAVVDNSNVIFIGCTAEAAPAMLRELTLQEGQKVVSFMVGITSDTLQALVLPATYDTTMIPFPSIAQGGSPILVYPASKLIDDLFGASDTVISLPSEEAFNEFLAAQAVLSPIAMILEIASTWLTDKTGDAQAAEQFLRLLVGGSLLARPLTDNNVLADLVASLNTAGGLNRQLREHFEKENVYSILRQGLDNLSTRLST